MTAGVLLLVLAAQSAPHAPVDVTADALAIQGHQGRAVYSGNAKAVRGDAVLTSDRIVADFLKGREAPSITRLEAQGNVEVRERDLWARGDRADFDNVTGTLVVTGNPEARQGGRRVAGSKLVFVVGSDTIEVHDARTLVDDVAGTVARGQKVTIDAQRLVIVRPKNQAVWSGRVRAKRGNTDIAARQLVAHYADDQSLTHLEGKGGVEMRDGDRWARGDKADFDNRTGILVMTGNPEARQGGHRMKGSKVIFDVENDLLDVRDARSVLSTEGSRGPRRSLQESP